MFVEDIKQKVGPLGQDQTLFFFIAKASIVKQGKNIFYFCVKFILKYRNYYGWAL